MRPRPSTPGADSRDEWEGVMKSKDRLISLFYPFDRFDVWAGRAMWRRSA